MWPTCTATLWMLRWDVAWIAATLLHLEMVCFSNWSWESSRSHHHLRNKLICNHGTSWNIMERHKPFNLHKLSIPLDIYCHPLHPHGPSAPWCACIATVPCVWGRQQRSCLGWGSWSVLTGPFRKLTAVGNWRMTLYQNMLSHNMPLA